MAECDGGAPYYAPGAFPFSAFTVGTPTIPKLYWDVESQEQRLKDICCEIDSVTQLADQLGVHIKTAVDDVSAMREEFEEFKTGGFEEYYEELLHEWVNANMRSIIGEALKMVFFGLTTDGYLCAYIPDSWNGIVFDTIGDYLREDYGCLVLSY